MKSIILLCAAAIITANTFAQQDKLETVLYASKDNIKSTVVSEDNSIVTIPLKNVYYDNYYGDETFEVYAGEAVNQSLVYLKVTTHLIKPITVAVVNCLGEEIMRYEAVTHPLAIGYGLKPGLYFIHVMQGRKEMVLRFSKGV